MEHFTAIAIAIMTLVIACLLFIPLLRIPLPKRLQEDIPANCYSDKPGPDKVLNIEDNQDALDWRVFLIDSAKKSIDFATFDLRCDTSGSIVLKHLIDAAKRDVHIRVLIDGLCSHLYTEAMFARLASHQNVEVKFYNPVSIAKPWKINARMHDKIMLFDNSRYILGGRNTSDKFLGRKTKGSCVDRELIVSVISDDDNKKDESSVFEVHDYFESLWTRGSTVSIFDKDPNKTSMQNTAVIEDHDDYRYDPSCFYEERLNEISFPTRKITLLTNPTCAFVKQPLLWHHLRGLMRCAKKVILKTPYIVCNDGMYRELVKIGRETQLKVITNAAHTNANLLGACDYMNSKRRMRRMGLDIFEYPDEYSNHTKTLVIDDRLSIVGSFNLDMRSVYLDTESMLVVDCKELNKTLADDMIHEIHSSRRIQEEGILVHFAWYFKDKVPKMRRIACELLRPFVPLVRHLL